MPRLRSSSWRVRAPTLSWQITCFPGSICDAVFDVHIQPAEPRFKLNVMMMLRLNMFHLLQAVSPNSIGLDIGVPARGWTGEAYQGHIFWDELFIFPFLNYRIPEITRSLLLYRHRRLGEARAAARSAGFQGLCFPGKTAATGKRRPRS